MLLASTITLAVMIALLVIVSARVVTMAQSDQRERAELLAENLADHLSVLPSPRSREELERAAALLRSGRPGIVGVRFWQASDSGFTELTAAEGSVPAEAMSADRRAAVRSGKPVSYVSENYSGPDAVLFHVVVPLNERGRVSGAVEVIERLDDLTAVAMNYARGSLWLALLAVALIMLSTWLLFRQFVYQPFEQLLSAMRRARAGELDVQAPLPAQDEIGQLSREFNVMLGTIHEMTRERERQQEVLRDRVREATAEARRRNEQLEAANLEIWRTSRRLVQLERLAAAGQTAAQFAHEVGTPLNLISCHVQLLRGELTPEQPTAEGRTEIIAEQIDRIERIVRRMLDRTRAEAAELSPLDLNALIRRILETTAPALEERRVELRAELAADLPPVAGDADRLQQVFINLVNNALDAMADGGSLRLTTKLAGAAAGRLPGPHVAVEVADTGCGMSAETKKHVFDPLYTTKRCGKGTGLGLVVVRQVMLEHNGEVEVRSEAGRGSVFYLYFPAAAASDADPGRVRFSLAGEDG
jgi:two-component system, NtrC family, sensor kinase